jgi:hypothetical protein
MFPFIAKPRNIFKRIDICLTVVLMCLACCVRLYRLVRKDKPASKLLHTLRGCSYITYCVRNLFASYSGMNKHGY